MNTKKITSKVQFSIKNWITNGGWLVLIFAGVFLIAQFAELGGKEFPMTDTHEAVRPGYATEPDMVEVCPSGAVTFKNHSGFAIVLGWVLLGLLGYFVYRIATNTAPPALQRNPNVFTGLSLLAIFLLFFAINKKAAPRCQQITKVEYQLRKDNNTLHELFK